ncbi:MAG: hypothetical protein NUV51_02960 [Sulfuricaulis sp.]|nr:hypothetical protein [Sulfuricaulis sp.]
MNRITWLILFCSLSSVASAEGWRFTLPLDVSPAPAAGVFHHLESAGRKNIAVSAGTVAVIWEDNHTGSPQIQVGFKPAGSVKFSEPVMVSGGKVAYEPVIAAIGSGRFIMAWEQDDEVWVRAGGPAGLDPAHRLAPGGARHASLAVSENGNIYAIWAAPHPRFAQIRLAQLHLDSETRTINSSPPVIVDLAPPPADQLYPSIVANAKGVTIAWEDRRGGHTVLMHSHSPDAKRFAAPAILNDQVARLTTKYGKGLGVMRVVLAPYGDHGVAAAWLDKRTFTEAYDVYAGFSTDGRHFGKNQKVQDDFATGAAQWHASIASDRSSRVAVVWDDARDDDADIWISWPEGGGWSSNMNVPGASGPGWQTDPSVTLEAGGNLHLVWIERAELNGPTRLRYALGTLLRE